jgi:transcriptional regulator with XRE-family HTH domain
MSAPAEARVLSLADRLKQRRKELGLSQAQAARELDVARTAYRLWEMEAAKPQPDRWRLISRWLGVSVTTMLLADDPDDAPSPPKDAEAAFVRAGRDWEMPLTDAAGYFDRAHRLVREGTENGLMTAAHAEELLSVIARIRQERLEGSSPQWEPVRLGKELGATARAPRAAREAVAFVGADLPAATVRDAQLLASELVSVSVRHGSPGGDHRIGFVIDIDRARLRVEVTDTGDGTPEGGAPPDDTEAYGLMLVDRIASRWKTSRVAAGTLSWFEIDLAPPGARPERP